MDREDDVDKGDKLYLTLLSCMLENARMSRICGGMSGIGILWIKRTGHILHLILCHILQDGRDL